MKIENVQVWGIGESIKACGFPMLKNGTERRAKILGNSRAGSGHDCYLKGIVVQADLTAPQYFWLQWQRYHFCDIISSQSKMHTIAKMDLHQQCNGFVWTDTIARLKQFIEFYNNYEHYTETHSYPYPKKELFKIIISNVPMGLMLKARITTNYLQLKTQYFQRRAHKLEEWQNYCNWVKSLPYFKEFILEKGYNE